MTVKSDIEIAREAKMKPIMQVGKKLGIPDDDLIPYGHTKAKVHLDYIDKLSSKKDGKLILVTAINPTPAGEGKTTTTVGLGGLARAFAWPLFRHERRCGRRRLCPDRADGRHQPAFHR
jgi:formyltetrahydrofolate synthetase